MNAVDTNVFVYVLDVDEPIKHAKAHELVQRLLQGGSTVIPWQVAVELLASLRRRQSKGRISADEVEDHFRKFLRMFPLIIPRAEVFQTCFDLHSRFSLSHWDSMLLAACKDAGVTTLYSEDVDADTDFDGLRIVNPFA